MLSNCRNERELETGKGKGRKPASKAPAKKPRVKKEVSAKELAGPNVRVTRSRAAAASSTPADAFPSPPKVSGNLQPEIQNRILFSDDLHPMALPAALSSKKLRSFLPHLIALDSIGRGAFNQARRIPSQQ